MTTTIQSESTYVRLLTEQIGHEFDAHTQYVAIAVWFDARDMPRLAAHYYRQALEERNHAMMIIQHMLDRDIPVTIPTGTPVRSEFADVRDPIALALRQEKAVTEQIEAIFQAARAEANVIGEQFMLWFLKEQVEEVASASTLLTVAERAGDNLFDLENFLARETIGDGGDSADAPAAAGGAV